MKSLKIENGDLVIEKGDFVILEGKEEVEQCIERTLTTNEGEWFLNLLHGLDYEVMFAKPFDEERARLAVIEAIHQDPRIETVEDVGFKFNREKRHMEIQVSARTSSGDVEGVIPVG